MPHCAVSGCLRSDTESFNGDSDIHFHSFPESKRFPRLFCSWFKFCDNQFIKLNRRNFICSEHFTEDDYDENDIAKKKLNPSLKFYMRLKPGAVPSIGIKSIEIEPCIKQEVTEIVEVKEETEEETILPDDDIELEEREDGWNILDDLLQNPFANRTDAEKKRIIKTPAPKPDLRNMTYIDGGRVRTFNPESYSKQNWLTGSDVRNKLYCWTCVLFPNKNNETWQRDGFNYLKCFARSLASHMSSIAHMNSQIEFSLFDKNTDVVPTVRLSHSSDVSINRYVLKQILDTAIELPGKNLVSPTENEHCTYNFRDVFELCVKSISAVPYSALFNDPDLYLHVLNAIADVIRDHIRKEINDTPFYSIQFYNISKSVQQIAVTVRFTADGTVLERFLGVFSLSFEDLAEHLNILLPNSTYKIVSQSYDGKFTSEELSTMCNYMKKLFPQALLVHNGSDKLDRIIAQSSCVLFQTKIFFSNLYEIIDFVASKSEVLCPNEEGSISTHDLSSSVRCLLTKRDEIRLKLQDMMLETRHDYQLVSKSTLTCNLLNIFQFVFLMLVFDKIFDKTVVIDNVYLSSGFDIDAVNERLRSLIDVIKTFNTKDDFDKIYDKAKQLTRGEDERNKFFELYQCILNTIAASLEFRFQDHAKLQFLKSFDIFNSNCKVAGATPYGYVQVQSFLSSFFRFYMKSCNIQRLSTEMKVLGTNERFLERCSSLDDLYNTLISCKLEGTLPEVYSLLRIILSMPVMPSINPDYSHSRRLTEYCNVKERQNYDNVNCLLYVENELLDKLTKQPDWEDMVINKFAINQSLESEFMYTYKTV